MEMRIKNILIAVLLAVMSSTLVWADEQENALDAYKRQDYKPALQIFKNEANQKKAYTQSSLGHMYYEGKGVPQDYAEAVKWFRLAELN